MPCIVTGPILDFTTLVKQPTQVVIKMTDELFIHRTVVEKAGTMLPQHAHHYDHISFIAAGSVRVWAGDVFLGEVAAPQGIVIRANTLHRFLTTADNTIIDCTHRVDKLGEPDIAMEAEKLI